MWRVLNLHLHIFDSFFNHNYWFSSLKSKIKMKSPKFFLLSYGRQAMEFGERLSRDSHPVFKYAILIENLRYDKTNQEMTTIENAVCSSQFLREGGIPCHTGPHGKAPRSLRQRLREDLSSELLLWFPWKEQMSQGKQFQDQLV